MSDVNVTTGSALGGEGGTLRFISWMNCSVLIRLRTLSCATITAPAVARFSLPPT